MVKVFVPFFFKFFCELNGTFCGKVRLKIEEIPLMVKFALFYERKKDKDSKYAAARGDHWNENRKDSFVHCAVKLYCGIS